MKSIKQQVLEDLKKKYNFAFTVVKLDTEVKFNKKGGGIVTLPAKKIVSLDYLLKQTIKKTISKVKNEIDEIKVLLPKTATESERVLMAHAVNIYKRKLKQKIIGK